MSYVWHEGGCVFTGDTLLIRGCGRTDFQQGSADKLYTSVQTKIFTLPDHYLVYSGHDYTGISFCVLMSMKYNFDYLFRTNMFNYFGRKNS